MQTLGVVAQTYDQTRELLAPLWQALWPVLLPAQQVRLMALPQPCHNHLHDRMRRPGRGKRLIAGCQRLAAFESELFLEGLRLYPHEICRAAEALGPLPEERWESLCAELLEHRLWQAGTAYGEDAFWDAVDTLAHHRELPQPVLDYLEARSPREDAPVELYSVSLRRFLVRAKLEKMRFATYAATKDAE